MKSQTTQLNNPQPTGLWLVGARGSISTTLVYGLGAMRAGLLEPVGVMTATPAFESIPWVDWQNWHVGGHDVCHRDIQTAADELVQAHILPPALPAQLTEWTKAYSEAIRPGLLDGDGDGISGVDPESVRLSKRTPRQQIEHLQDDWKAFESARGLGTTVVVYVASTEARQELHAEWSDLAALEAALDAEVAQPASLLYAYAALASGRPFVNFTPNVGAQPAALQQLAQRECVPHCGKDGKTGETLLKTSLAPVFHARAMRVLSWQGYNMLGNRDGEVLRMEGHREAKLANKDEALRSILSQEGALPGGDLHSHVGIDYVPSLGDWKTAWDYVHFEGFLGTRMSLQFTWAGSDSALAAPLVLDLARLSELAKRRGESGPLAYTACFFKAPLGGGTHDFHQQYQGLLDHLGHVQSELR